MKKLTSSISQINEHMNLGIKLGVAHVCIDNEQYNGREVIIKGKKMINFGSGSYMGLETNKALKAAAIDAVQRFGTQFPSSRAFLAINLYQELEDLLEKIFGYPTIAAPSTSLGHISVIPILIQSNDVMLLDHQAHASIHNAVKMAQTTGAHKKLVRHNRMDLLEQHIQELSATHNNIWYMTDGVFSMFGDRAPCKALLMLLDKYPKFHLYIDDAHGMGWIGRNGSGYVLDTMPIHPRMILLTSLNKSFAAGGGAIVCPNLEIKQLIRNCGSTLIFSGPIQPALLGAGIASAKLHLSNDWIGQQKQLKSRMQLFISEAKRLKLPLVDESETPIFFIGVGLPDIGFELCTRMASLGYYTNIAAYPAVPYHKTGLRITTTLHQQPEDITQMLQVLSKELKIVLKKHNYSIDKIYKSFKLKRTTPTNQITNTGFTPSKV